jgi:hypothetical protein
LFLQALNAPADHKAQAISTGWKTDELNASYLNLKRQSIFLVEVLRNIAWKHKTKNNAVPNQMLVVPFPANPRPKAII